MNDDDDDDDNLMGCIHEITDIRRLLFLFPSPSSSKCSSYDSVVVLVMLT
jgi:hypothetical protein